MPNRFGRAPGESGIGSSIVTGNATLDQLNPILRALGRDPIYNIGLPANQGGGLHNVPDPNQILDLSGLSADLFSRLGLPAGATQLRVRNNNGLFGLEYFVPSQRQLSGKPFYNASDVLARKRSVATILGAAAGDEQSITRTILGG